MKWEQVNGSSQCESNICLLLLAIAARTLHGMMSEHDATTVLGDVNSCHNEVEPDPAVKSARDLGASQFMIQYD